MAFIIKWESAIWKSCLLFNSNIKLMKKWLWQARGPFPSQHRAQRTIGERTPRFSLRCVRTVTPLASLFQVAFIIKRAWETQNHQILLLNLCLRMHEMCTPRQRDAESPSCALRSLSQTARNVHSETERFRITKFCSRVSVSDCTECALWDRETQNHQVQLFSHIVVRDCRKSFR